jgi:hypothetical protein
MLEPEVERLIMVVRVAPTTSFLPQTSGRRELTCIIVMIIDIASLGWSGPLHSKL